MSPEMLANKSYFHTIPKSSKATRFEHFGWRVQRPHQGREVIFFLNFSSVKKNVKKSLAEKNVFIVQRPRKEDTETFVKRMSNKIAINLKFLFQCKKKFIRFFKQKHCYVF